MRQISRLIWAIMTLSVIAGAQQSLANTGVGQTDSFLPVDNAFEMRHWVEGGNINVEWVIAPGYYLYKKRISVTLDQNDTQQPAPTFTPKAEEKDDPYFGRQWVFHNRVLLQAAILDTTTEDTNLTIKYQGCAEAGLCYPPQSRHVTLHLDNVGSGRDLNTTEAKNDPISSIINSTTGIETSLTQAETDTSSASGLASFLETANLPLLIGTFFLLGIGLTFTPCVLPMIPILSGIIVGQKNMSTPRAFVMSSVYVLAMAATYASAGVLVGYFGAKANIQAMMQNPWMIGVFSSLFIALAIAMFGFYELQLPAPLRDKLDAMNRKQQGGHLLSVAIMGVLSALVVSPCVSAPLAGALIYISSTGDAILGGGALFSMALGMGLPLVIIGTSGARIMPKAGAWMERVKQFFGVLLLGVALWLLERVLPLPIILVLWACLFIVLAVHLGLFNSAPAEKGWQKSIRGVSILFLAYGLLLLVGATSGQGTLAQPLKGFSVSSGNAPMIKLAESSFTRINNLKALNSHLGQGTVMVDFYADWCISCKLMEEEVFMNNEVNNLMATMDFLQFDVTDNSPENTRLLEHFGLFGPPAILFFDAKGNEIASARIQGEMTKDEFMQHVKKQVMGYQKI